MIDWLQLGVVCIFFAAMLVIGFLSSRKQKTAADFFVGGRKFGLLTVTATQIASAFGGGMMVAHVGIGYQWGFSEFVYIGLIVPAGVLLLAWLAAGWLRQQSFYTTSDWMCAQYGESRLLRATTSIVASLVTFGWWVSQPIAAGKVLNVLTGVPLEWGIILAAVIVVIYTMTGGIIAVAYTDVAQLGLMIFALFVMLPIVVTAAGGLDTIFATVPEENLTLLAAGEDVIWGWVMAVLPGQMVLQIYHQRIYSAKSVKVAKQGLYNLAFSCILAGVWASLLGMAVFTLNPDLPDQEQAMMWAIMAFLPQWMALLVLAAVAAAIVSTADSALHSAAASITRDFYQVLFKPNASDENVLRFSKICIVILGVLGVVIGLYVPVVFKVLVMGYTLTSAGLLFPLFLGRIWSGATGIGALCGMLAGVFSVLLFSFFPALENLLPPIAAGLIASFAVMVTVSLIKPQKLTPSAQVD